MFTLFLMRDRAGSPNIRDTQTMHIGRGNLDISEDLKYGKTRAGSNIPLNNNSPNGTNCSEQLDRLNDNLKDHWALGGTEIIFS